MDVVPVIFLNPRTKLVDTMPWEMVQAYLPNGTDLNLEDAARVASIRDEEAALNLLESVLPEEIEVFSADLPALR